MDNKQEAKTNIVLLQKVTIKSNTKMFFKAKIVLRNMSLIKTKSLNIFFFSISILISQYIYFFLYGLPCWINYQLSWSILFDHILIRHKIADSSLFHRPFRNKFLSQRFMVCNLWKRLFSLFSLYFPFFIQIKNKKMWFKRSNKI